MTTRRDVLKIGALGSLTVAGVGLADTSRASETRPPALASTLAPANTPVPYTGVFRRPPELVPYADRFDDGDPARPFDHYAVTEGWGPATSLPGGLSTPVAGYNGIFPGPTIRVRRGTRSGGADAQRLPGAPASCRLGRSTP